MNSLIQAISNLDLSYSAFLISLLSFFFTIFMAIFNYRHTKKTFRRSTYPSLGIDFYSDSFFGPYPVICIYSKNKPAYNVRCSIHFKKKRLFSSRKKVKTKVEPINGPLDNDCKQTIQFEEISFKKILKELDIVETIPISNELVLKGQPFLNKLTGKLLRSSTEWINNHYKKKLIKKRRKTNLGSEDKGTSIYLQSIEFELDKYLMSHRSLFYKLKRWRKRIVLRPKNPKDACLEAIIYVSYQSEDIVGEYILRSERYILNPIVTIKDHAGYTDFAKHLNVSEFDMPKVVVLNSPYFDLPCSAMSDSQKMRKNPNSIKLKFKRRQFAVLAS